MRKTAHLYKKTGYAIPHTDLISMKISVHVWFYVKVQSVYSAKIDLSQGEVDEEVCYANCPNCESQDTQVCKLMEFVLIVIRRAMSC